MNVHEKIRELERTLGNIVLQKCMNDSDASMSAEKLIHFFEIDSQLAQTISLAYTAIKLNELIHEDVDEDAA